MSVSKSLIRCAICASSCSFLKDTGVNDRAEIFMLGDPARLARCASAVAADLEACKHGLVIDVAVLVVVVFFVVQKTC